MMDMADFRSIMALLGLKTAASSARFANVGALGILRLNEEYVSLRIIHLLRS
jgi:hypothetical protein